MNLQSEIEYFVDLGLLDKARLLNMFLHELADEARSTYGPGTEAVHDTAHLRFVNEIVWCYSVGGKSRRGFGRKHDTILWYALDPGNYTFDF